MDVIVKRSVDAASWDAMVARQPASTAYQTTSWATYLARVAGAKAFYLTAQEGNTVIASLLLVKKPYLAERLGNHGVRFPQRLWSALGYNTFFWMQGPVFYEPKRAHEALHAILERVETLAREERVKKLLASSVAIDALSASDVPKGYNVQEWRTSVIEITDEETMLKRIKEAARKNINKLLKDPAIETVRVEKFDDQVLRAYWKILRQTRKRLGESMPPHYPGEAYFQGLDGQAGLVLVKKEGEVIGGMGVIFWNGTATEIASAVGDRALREKEYVGDLLKWEIMRWAQERGIRRYDLMGFSPVATDTKEEGIARFKQKFGGTDEPYYYLTKVFK